MDARLERGDNFQPGVGKGFNWLRPLGLGPRPGERWISFYIPASALGPRLQLRLKVRRSENHPPPENATDGTREIRIRFARNLPMFSCGSDMKFWVYVSNPFV